LISRLKRPGNRALQPFLEIRFAPSRGARKNPGN